MEVIGYTKETAYELATQRGMHPGSANAVMEFIAEVQSRALSQASLGEGEETLHDETEGSTCD